MELQWSIVGGHRCRDGASPGPVLLAIELQWSGVVAATGASRGPPGAAMELQWSVGEGPLVLPQSIPGATMERRLAIGASMEHYRCCYGKAAMK